MGGASSTLIMVMTMIMIMIMMIMMKKMINDKYENDDNDALGFLLLILRTCAYIYVYK